MADEELKGRRLIFAREYCLDHNGVRAYRAAGYKCASDEAAAVGASRLLRNAKVSAEIARFNTNRCNKLDVSADEITKRLKQLAFFDIRKLYNEDGSLKRIIDLDDDTAAAVCGVQVDKLYAHFAKGKAEEMGSTTKVKLCDSGQNCERLGRHVPGYFRDQMDVEVTFNLAEVVAAARRRVAEGAARDAERDALLRLTPECVSR